MRKLVVRSIITIVLVACASRADAIGWDSNDFLISVGPSFITKIGVFDQDLTFKGYLDDNFVTVAGMDFDAAGRLVAAGGGNANEVRVYDSSGARVGGFASSLLVNPGQLDVAPNGNYLIASGGQGGPPNTISVREFTPQGALVHEYRSGGAFGASAIPGNRVWSGQPGSTGVDVFDLSTAQNLGTISIAGVAGVQSITYDATTNTVLIATIQSNAAIETAVNGTVFRTFATPINAALVSVTRGPDGDVFATGRSLRTVFRWHASGDFVSSTMLPTDTAGAVIVWAGNVPEPSSTLAVYTLVTCVVLRRSR